MNLTAFISALFEQGKVTVDFILKPFEQEDLQTAETRLKTAHTKATSEMPGEWPAFHAEAALWSAQWMYRAMQLVLLRDQPDEVVETQLKPWHQSPTAEMIATVDLTLRHLPGVMHFAKRLAPEDVLVKKLNEAACQWPLSSVGMEIQGTLQMEEILRHPALRAACRDRIIAAKDHRRLTDPRMMEMVEAALGDHAAVFWPGFETEKMKLITHEH